MILIKLLKTNIANGVTMQTIIYRANEINNSQRQEIVSQVRPAFLWYSPGSDDAKIAKKLFDESESEVEVYQEGSEVAGFGILCMKSIVKAKVLFRHGTVIMEPFRSSGQYQQIVKGSLERHKYNPEIQWTSTRTKNPRVYRCWHKILKENLYPAPGCMPDQEMQNIALQIVENDPSFDPKKLIIRNAYRKDRTGAEYYTCREQWIIDFFQKNLGEHDAFLLLSRV